ncbi:MAG: hypothetical protein Q8N81_05990 [bacterium]|nr:hypothetical protein [bacterium]
MKFFKLILMAIFIVSVLNAQSAVLAYVMESGSYRIQQDSVNFGGTEDSSSASYKVRDTAGEIATGLSSSASYNLYAGYRQMDEVYISITSPSDVTLTPAIGGITGGTGNGYAEWTVITDDPAGYSLTITASSSPALISGSNSFADYTPAGGKSGNPDFVWGIDNADSEFGFTPEGNDIVQKFLDDGGSPCGTGSTDTASACWYYASTTEQTISQSASSNHPSGTLTRVRFRATSGSSHVQIEGTYTATTTVTALAL